MSRSVRRATPSKLIWRASVAQGTGQPGAVLDASDAGVRIACGEGALLATELQRSGGGRLAAADFLRGFAIPAGEILGAAR